MERRTPEDEESIRNHDESAAYAVNRYVEEHGLEFKEDELNEVIMQCKPTIKYFKETFNVPRPHEVHKDIDAIGRMDSTTNKTKKLSIWSCNTRNVSCVICCSEISTTQR